MTDTDKIFHSLLEEQVLISLEFYKLKDEQEVIKNKLQKLKKRQEEFKTTYENIQKKLLEELDNDYIKSFVQLMNINYKNMNTVSELLHEDDKNIDVDLSVD